MEKAKWLKRTNLLLFILLLYQIVTALLSPVIEPDVFEMIHPIGGILLVVFAGVHIGLNWGWVRALLLARKRPDRA